MVGCPGSARRSCYIKEEREGGGCYPHLLWEECDAGWEIPYIWGETDYNV